MSIEIKVPDLGDGVDSGDVLEIMVSEGDMIVEDQGIVELETDKATVEVPSTHAGRVTKILVEAGQSVAAGTALIALEPTEAAKPAAKPKPSTKPEPPAPEPVAAEPAVPAAEPEPEPRPASPAPVASQPAPAATPAPVTPAAKTPAAESGGEIAAGPAIRRFAREVGVDLSQVTGTGPGGRIQREDVLEAVRQTSQQIAASRAPSKPEGPGAPASDAWGPVRVERMSKIRRTIAAQMHKSWETCPRVTNFDDADVTELERIRQSSKKDYAASGIRLSQLPFVIKSVAMALKHNPVINATVDMDNGMITYKDYVSIGIAVDTERGLVVPVLRNADRMSFPEIARALSDISDKARNNDFSIEDLRGGTFSISNLGAIGGTYATPVINIPEVAILLLGRTRKMPVVLENDKIVVRQMMPLSLSYDHRLVDGAAAARFLNDVISYLEVPSRLLLAP